MPGSSDYAVWRPRFAEAMDPRFFNVEYLDWLLGNGRAGFWATDKAAIVAEIKVFPTSARAVSGVIAAGELEEVEMLIAHAEAWGRQNGCEYALIESRPGWVKAMKKHGYTLFQASIMKEL